VLERADEEWKYRSVVTPRVLINVGTSAAWSRGILRGFSRVAHEQGWSVLHYPPDVDLKWAMSQWPLSAAVLGPCMPQQYPAPTQDCVLVSVNADRTSEGVASVCLDEARIAQLALSHLLGRGFRNVTTFRFGGAPFGVLREQRFAEAAGLAGVRYEAGWWAPDATPPRTSEHPPALKHWLTHLPKPCGVFACTDSWARVVSRNARAANLRVPEDVALIGVDNDAVECEIMAPPLSSVAIPWRSVGEAAAQLVVAGLRGREIGGKRVLISPVDVVTRRSTDTFAIADPLVAKAVAWIHEHAHKRLTVPMVVKAAGVTRQRLERHFRRALGRTVMHEMRRARIEIARLLLLATDLTLLEVAKRSGFTNASLLSVAFSREVGVPPSVYRRSAGALLDAPSD
jgi:LacI family transcriptional regulator